MKSTLQYRRNKNMESSAAAVSPYAKDAATRLEALGCSNKLEIQHQFDYMCWAFWLRSHKYVIYDQQKHLSFTGGQHYHGFGISSCSTGSGSPLLIYQLSHEPLFEMHFGTPGLLEFTSSNVSVTLPSEVLIGSLTKEDTAQQILGTTTTTLTGFDFDGHFLFVAKPGGRSVSQESIHNVVMNSSRIAKIRSCPGSAVLEYKKEDISADVRALLLSTAIWLEIIERKKPRWRREGFRWTRS